MKTRQKCRQRGSQLIPLIVLTSAGAVGQSDGPVKVLAVEAGGVRRAPLVHHLSAEQTAISPLVRGRPPFIVALRAWDT